MNEHVSSERHHNDQLNLKTLGDQELLKRVRELVTLERQTLNQLLDYLQEVQNRRLFADLGYSSLFNFLLHEHGYSRAAAYRRVSALKMVQKVPEAKELISRGEVNLTVMALTHQHTKKQSPQKTREILESVKGQNKEQAEKTLFEARLIEPTRKRDVAKRESKSTTRVHISLDDETFELLKELKAIKGLDNNEALKLSLKTTLKSLKASIQKSALKTAKKSPSKAKARTRYIPASIKNRIRLRADHRCEFPGCTERRHLEFEHIIPYSLGGTHTVENLKLYCRSHNQRSAIKTLGLQKMGGYLNGNEN